MRLSYLLKGPSGHPLHPPLTDATVGAYTVATVAGVVGGLGGWESKTATAWWLALAIGLALTLPTALTGLIDWFELWERPAWRTATLHMVTMLFSASLFGLAAGLGFRGFVRGEVPPGPLILTIAAFAVLTLGGWLGGTLVFVHGVRVRKPPTEGSSADGLHSRDQ